MNAPVLNVLQALTVAAWVSVSPPVSETPALQPPETCALAPAEDAFLVRVREALDAAAPDDAKRALSALQREAAADTLAPIAAEDVVLHYRLAAVIGARSLVEGGLTRVRLAAELARQAERVLALDPDQAGAHFMMGRLHAGVMRLDRATRFLATRLLGGRTLSGASWDAARAHLEAAVQGDPCSAEHHLELARLYSERGEPEAAKGEAEAFLALTGPASTGWTPARQRMLERLLEAS